MTTFIDTDAPTLPSAEPCETAVIASLEGTSGRFPDPKESEHADAASCGWRGRLDRDLQP